MTKPTVKQLSLDHIAIDKAIHFDDALYVASELIKIWQSDYDSLPFSEGVNQMEYTKLEKVLMIEKVNWKELVKKQPNLVCDIFDKLMENSDAVRNMYNVQVYKMEGQSNES